LFKVVFDQLEGELVYVHAGQSADVCVVGIFESGFDDLFFLGPPLAAVAAPLVAGHLCLLLFVALASEFVALVPVPLVDLALAEPRFPREFQHLFLSPLGVLLKFRYELLDLDLRLADPIGLPPALGLSFALPFASLGFRGEDLGSGCLLLADVN